MCKPVGVFYGVEAVASCQSANDRRDVDARAADARFTEPDRRVHRDSGKDFHMHASYSHPNSSSQSRARQYSASRSFSPKLRPRATRSHPRLSRSTASRALQTLHFDSGTILISSTFTLPRFSTCGLISPTLASNAQPRTCTSSVPRVAVRLTNSWPVLSTAELGVGVPFEEFAIWTIFLVLRDPDRHLIQSAVLFPVVEVISQPSADVQSVVSSDRQIPKVKERMHIRAQQEAVVNAVRTVVGHGSDMCCLQFLVEDVESLNTRQGGRDPKGIHVRHPFER